MSRVFVTGDKHGDFTSLDDYQKVREFCKRFNTSKADYMIVLGDNGVNYFGDWRDVHTKEKLAKLPIRFIMIRGNHDKRPSTTWKHVFIETPVIRGWFIEDPYFTDILYTEEYGAYQFAGVNTFVICGAYSIDKNYRISMYDIGYTNFRWFADEQLSEKEMDDAKLKLIDFMYKGDFVIMSHTCPLSFKPVDSLEGVDESMEIWMDDLYDTAIKMFPNNLKKWYCGHWHIDNIIEPVRFMYHDIVEVGNAG